MMWTSLSLVGTVKNLFSHSIEADVIDVILQLPHVPWRGGAI
jgi:hypothetical protein